MSAKVLEDWRLFASEHSLRPKLLLAVSGGIAAYKIPNLVSLCVQKGYQVQVLLSAAAARFVSKEALEALSACRVYSDLWQSSHSSGSSPVLHIGLAEAADLLLVAPASYNLLGKLACGLADDLLTTTLAAFSVRQKPALLAPAMNETMWQQEVLQHNIALLQQRGYELVQPEDGFLACRIEGAGRMPGPEVLLRHVQSSWRSKQLERFWQQQGKASSPLRGKRVLLTAGPTREAIDPVRYISNHSSGRMGVELALAARDLGAEVCVLAGIMDIQCLRGMKVLSCESAEQMRDLAAKHLEKADWLLAVAAVCDFFSKEKRR